MNAAYVFTFTCCLSLHIAHACAFGWNAVFTIKTQWTWGIKLAWNRRITPGKKMFIRFNLSISTSIHRRRYADHVRFTYLLLIETPTHRPLFVINSWKLVFSFSFEMPHSFHQSLLFTNGVAIFCGWKWCVLFSLQNRATFTKMSCRSFCHSAISACVCVERHIVSFIFSSFVFFSFELNRLLKFLSVDAHFMNESKWSDISFFLLTTTTKSNQCEVHNEERAHEIISCYNKFGLEWENYMVYCCWQH